MMHPRVVAARWLAQLSLLCLRLLRICAPSWFATLRFVARARRAAPWLAIPRGARGAPTLSRCGYALGHTT
eukprot:3929850-Pyramimonas_sp.AAC.1